MMIVVRPCITSRRRCRISASVCVSTLAIASSRMRMAGSLASARASAARCFCPPESVTPRSPTIVEMPWGKSCTSLASCAICIISRVRSALSDGTPKPIFSSRGTENKNVSCGTNPTWRRSEVKGISRTSTPSIKTCPLLTSNRRGSRLTRVDFPLPVGPTIASEEPAFTRILISCSTS